MMVCYRPFSNPIIYGKLGRTSLLCISVGEWSIIRAEINTQIYLVYLLGYTSIQMPRAIDNM